MRLVVFAGHESPGAGASYQKYDEHEWAHRVAASVVYHAAQRGHVPFLLVGGADKYDTKLALIYEPDVVLSIHFNSVPNSAAHGTEAWYTEPDSKHLAESITAHLGCLGLRRRGAKFTPDPDHPKGLHVLNAIREIPNVLIEVCFLSNAHDRGIMDRGDFLKESGLAICEALSEWTVQP